MTDYERTCTLFVGAFIGVAFSILGFYMFKPEVPKLPVASKSNFEVVDTYSYENRTCSVIRYTTPSTTWEYFLDCKEVKK
jgi:dTDP-glucose pyrophosphorylase